MLLCLSSVIALVRATFISRRDLALENLALRQQLAVLKTKKPRPRLRPSDRILWLLLRRIWPGWQEALIVVKPETVIHWHRQGFRTYWRWKSRAVRSGRPRADPEARQRWMTFLHNHRDCIAAMNFFTVPRSSQCSAEWASNPCEPPIGVRGRMELRTAPSGDQSLRDRRPRPGSLHCRVSAACTIFMSGATPPDFFSLRRPKPSEILKDLHIPVAHPRGQALPRRFLLFRQCPVAQGHVAHKVSLRHCPMLRLAGWRLGEAQHTTGWPSRCSGASACHLSLLRPVPRVRIHPQRSHLAVQVRPQQT